MIALALLLQVAPDVADPPRTLPRPTPDVPATKPSLPGTTGAIRPPTATAPGHLPRPIINRVAPAAPGGKPPRDQVLAAVRAEWGTYDVRHQGRLGPLEFGTWVMRANGATVQAPGAPRGSAGIKPVTAMNATARAFAQADANHDGGVTPEELAAFLSR